MRHWSLILESDQRLRQLERDHHANPGNDDIANAYAKALIRIGRPHDFVKPHAEAYQRAKTDHADILDQMYTDNPPNWRDISTSEDEVSKSRDRLIGAASRVAQPVGIYAAPPRPHSEPTTSRHYGRYRHIKELSQLHNGSGGEHATHAGHGFTTFPTEAHAKSFIASLKHHYPKIKTDITPEHGDEHSVDYSHPEEE